jgi:hypothetical protein
MGLRRILFTMILCMACLFGCESKKDIYPEAKALADKYFIAALAGNIQNAMTYYDERFFEERSPEEWAEMVSGTWEKIGLPFEYNLDFAEMTVAVSGTEVVLTYAVGYLGGREFDENPGIETLVFFKPTTGGPIKLIGHKFSNNAVR